MSTNYYGVYAPCPHCGQTKQKIHIGKYSNKEFTSNFNALSIIRAIETLDMIQNEYGTMIRKDEMKRIVKDAILKIVDYEFC